MALKYLAGERIQGTAAERAALTAGVAAISDTGLKAYWKFINSASPLPNASVSSATLGTDADAVISGMTFGTTSPLSTEGVFDGSNDKLTIGSSYSDFNFMHNSSALWTVCFWLKDNLTHGDGGIFNDSDSAWVSQNVGVNIVTIGTGGRLRFNVNTGTAQGDVAYLLTDNGYIPNTSWHFYCVTYDHSLGSNNFKLTMDDDNLVQATKGSGTPSSGNAAQIPTIGVHTGSNGWLGGSVSEMSVWNRILTSSEIEDLYNDGDGLAIYSASTNLPFPNGTVFEESDTGKHYMWNGTSAWNEMSLYG